MRPEYLQAKMKMLVFVALSCLFAFGCSRSSSPTQVTGPIEFDRYEISPPHGYWYFPKARQISADFRKKKDFFAVLTFWPNKEDIPDKNREYVSGEQIIFFNFAIAENKYDSYEAYYRAAEKAGVTYIDLSAEEEVLQKIQDWSCKQENTSLYGIECISLKFDLLTIGVYGNDKNQVLRRIPTLEKMMESLQVKSNKQP